jgi:hypothetical protein
LLLLQRCLLPPLQILLDVLAFKLLSELADTLVDHVSERQRVSRGMLCDRRSKKLDSLRIILAVFEFLRLGLQLCQGGVFLILNLELFDECKNQIISVGHKLLWIPTR